MEKTEENVGNISGKFQRNWKNTEETMYKNNFKEYFLKTTSTYQGNFREIFELLYT